MTNIKSTEDEKKIEQREETMQNALNKSVKQGREGEGGLGAVAVDPKGIKNHQNNDHDKPLSESNSSIEKEIVKTNLIKKLIYRFKK